METYKNQYFEGERPLYARRNGLRLEEVVIGPGESALKEGAGIEAVRCEFKGKYPFWECDGFIRAQEIGEIILDENLKQPGNCEIQL